MPFIRFSYTDEELEAAEASGKRLIRAQTVPLEKAITIFRVQQGLIQGTEQQVEYCKRVYRVYIDRTFAPRDYLEKYPVLGEQLAEARQVPLAYKDAE